MIARLAGAAVVLLLVAWVSACEDGDTPSAASPEATTTAVALQPSPGGTSPQATPSLSPASPTASASPSPSPSPGQGILQRIPVQPLRFGAEVDLPENTAILIELGCFQCDGPATGLARLYRDRSGQIRTDTLLFHPERFPDRPYIAGLSMLPDGSEIAVSICSRGYCGGIAPATPNAMTTILRSRDGGVTWTVLFSADGLYNVAAALREGVVVFGPFPGRPNHYPRVSGSLMLFPGERPVQLPPGIGAAEPIALPDGTLGWLLEDRTRILRADGGEFLRIGLLPPEMQFGELSLSPDGQRAVLTSFTPPPERMPGRPQFIIGVYGRDGVTQRRFQTEDGYQQPRVWLEARMVLGNATFPTTAATPPGLIEYRPALFDLEAGEARPLRAPFQPGRNRIHAVMRGPFARVAAAGDCLNVRAGPEASAMALTCAADGVLLVDLGETREAGGTVWRRVRTPAGQEGWASDAFLER